MDTQRSNSVTFAEFRRGWQNVGLHLAYDPEDYRLLFDRVFDRDRGTNRVRWVDMKLALSKFKLKSPKACSPRRRSSLLAAARAYDRDRARTAVQLSVSLSDRFLTWPSCSESKGGRKEGGPMSAGRPRYLAD